ncbi:MAG: outer membrane beta-barrel protein [Bacteroidales bacterium]|jgi:hypothetical protein|nr:outer membrane beta-barrel protein [Bacteroidales bacterium]
MKNLALSIVFCFILLNAFGQNGGNQVPSLENDLKIKTESSFPFYAGIETGFIRYTFQGTGYYNELEKLRNEKFFMNLTANVIFGYNISDQWSLETGLRVQNFKNWYYYIRDYSYSLTSFTGPSNYLTIPIQSMYRFKLLKNKLEIKPYAGISFYVLTKSPGEYAKGTEISFHSEYDENNTVIDRDTIYTITSSTNYDNQVSLVANAGLRLEYAICPRISIIANGNLALGFSDINRLAIKIEEQENTLQGDIIRNGTGYSLNAGLKYKFGK